jgi:uncharacterized protein YcbK (DUF882 family)
VLVALVALTGCAGPATGPGALTRPAESATLHTKPGGRPDARPDAASEAGSDSRPDARPDRRPDVLPAAAQPSPARPPPDERDAARLAAWRAASAAQAAAVERFEQHLRAAGLADEVPLHELLRSASDWQRCAAEPFAVPPDSHWPRVRQLLGLLRELRQRGLLGPLELHSAYRDATLNRCAGGAPGSAHVHAFAVDFTPTDPAAADALCRFWREHGAGWQMGYGRYPSGRLHLDTWRHRRWGVDC